MIADKRGAIVVPEGALDAKWLREWQGLAEAHRDNKTALELLDRATIADPSECAIKWCTSEAEYNSAVPLCKEHYEKFDEVLCADRCSWCDKPAVAKSDATDTRSCGQGQGDGLEHHDVLGVQYTALSPDGIGWKRIR